MNNALANILAVTDTGDAKATLRTMVIMLIIGGAATGIWFIPKLHIAIKTCIIVFACLAIIFIGLRALDLF